MKEIRLTQGKAALVDDDVHKMLSHLTWNAQKVTRVGGRVEYYASSGSVFVKGEQRHIRTHILLMGYPPPGMVVDHIDGNGLNNQRHNLRFATIRQNCANRKKANGKTSRFLGVSKHKDGKWVCSIRVLGKAIYLGLFQTEEDAASAYDLASVEHFGEFATLNFPKETSRGARTYQHL